MGLTLFLKSYPNKMVVESTTCLSLQEHLNFVFNICLNYDNISIWRDVKRVKTDKIQKKTFTLSCIRVKVFIVSNNPIDCSY